MGHSGPCKGAVSSAIVLSFGVDCVSIMHKVGFRRREGKDAQNQCRQREDAARPQQERNGCSGCTGGTCTGHFAFSLPSVISGIGCALPYVCWSEPFLNVSLQSHLL